MSKHTPEPWKQESAGNGSLIFGAVGEFEILGETTGERWQENCRRIVACVNACKGISNDRLEKMVPGTLANLLTLKGEK